MVRAGAGLETGDALPTPAVKGRRWAAERELLTALVYRPSRLDEAVAGVPPDRIEDADLRRLYEALLENPARRDGDIESIVLGMEDTARSGLAVELFERAEAIQSCRDPADTGDGPVGRMFDDALAALGTMEEEADLAARNRDMLATICGLIEKTPGLLAEAVKKAEAWPDFLRWCALDLRDARAESNRIYGWLDEKAHALARALGYPSDKQVPPMDEMIAQAGRLWAAAERPVRDQRSE